MKTGWLHAEQALIGAVMLDGMAYWQIADKIDAGDFAGQDHALIWSEIAKAAQAGQPVDVVTVSMRLRGDVARYLIHLGKDAPGTANVVAYADLARSAADHRRVVAAGLQISKLAPDRVDDAPRILADATAPKCAAMQQMADVLVTWHTELERRYVHGDAITGLSTGIAGLDAMTAGMQPTDLIILAARPSMGKSALAGQLAHFAAANGHAVALFSLEMTAAQFANRMIAAQASVGMSALRAPKTIEEDAWPRISLAMAAMKDLPLFFDETPAISVEQLTARAKQLNAKNELKLIVIDYLQLMKMRSFENTNGSIGEITGALKRLAKELKLPIVLLSQLNRSLEARSDRRPILSDLRASGDIEQDADMVIFLYRDEVYNDQSPHKGFAEAIIRKQRNGVSGTVPLKSELQFCRFAHCDELPGEESGEAPRSSVRTFKKRTA